MGYTAYKTKSGERVPSVTTILKRFQESGGLIAWANQQGLEGITLDEARQEAMGPGTLVHKMVEKFAKNEDPFTVEGPPEWLLLAKQAFDNFGRWVDQTKLKIIATEVGMVSEAYRYGGTLDAVGIVHGKRSVLDWKSSKKFWSDHLLQLAAYVNLWNENHPKEPIDGGVHLCRFSRDHADFEHRHFFDLELPLKQFLLFRDAYELDKQIKKRAS